jgi:GT2 family glycosyltransferase
VTFSVVILSARADNLVACVRSLLANEPRLAPERIVVVDDGARAEAESCLPPIRWVAGAKPFVFARNANLGIQAAGTDVILLNDDACLLTPDGFSRLADVVGQQPDVGVCSAGIAGVIGNRRQSASPTPGFRYEPSTLAFVCVYVPRDVYTRIGPLDERFTGYGFDDNDYCRRVLGAGLRLGIWDGCVVDHSGRLPSTFRSRPDLRECFLRNQQLFHQKWSAAPPLTETPTAGRVDLLYLACNRLEFTRETFTTLLNTTDWPEVRQLVVYDDGSVDGTAEWLQNECGRTPVPTRFVRTRFGSPVSAMSDFIRSSNAPILAKTDNDAVLPPGWLRQSLAVLDRHPELALLGIEALYPHNEDPNVVRSYAPAEFISGLGLYRRAAFAASQPVAYRKYFGLEEWQVAQGPGLVRGWINPAFPVFLLDRLPIQPWRQLSDSYIRQGWQRPWQGYEPTCTLWHWRWPARQMTPVASSTTTPTGDARFVGALRIKNEAAHVHEVLSRLLEVCGRVVVFDDHSTDSTAAICQSFGSRVTLLSSPFEGLDEARDKNYLLRYILQNPADWVLWIDGDEVLERSGPEKLRVAIDQAGSSAAIFSLRVAYVWNDPHLVRVDGVYGNIARPSLFRLRGQALDRLHFPNSGRAGNLHCGNVPLGLVGERGALDVRLKHYGYLTREQRQIKYAWYTRIDPNNHAEDNYRHLAEIPGARLAPGPLQLVPWTE